MMLLKYFIVAVSLFVLFMISIMSIVANIIKKKRNEKKIWKVKKVNTIMKKTEI